MPALKPVVDRIVSFGCVDRSPPNCPECFRWLDFPPMHGDDPVRSAVAFGRFVRRACNDLLDKDVTLWIDDHETFGVLVVYRPIDGADECVERPEPTSPEMLAAKERLREILAQKQVETTDLLSIKKQAYKDHEETHGFIDPTFEERDALVIVKDEFWREYKRLARSGKCDSVGGMEYRRVRIEWDRANRPGNMTEFIVRRANIPS